jgi:hypothetical protein
MTAKGPSKEKPKKPKPSLSAVFRGMFPFKLERLDLSEGSLVFQDSRTPLTAMVDDISVTASNFTNTRALSDTLFGDVRASARVMGSGTLGVNLKVNPVAPRPTFDMDFQLQKLALVPLNPLFRTYANLDVKEGTFSMAGEAAVREGKIDGYVRPALEKVKVFSWKQDVKEEKEGPLHLAWEGLVEAVKKVLQSVRPQKQVATRVPLHGDVDDPKASLADTAMNVLRNAFLEAILPVLEHSVHL